MYAAYWFYFICMILNKTAQKRIMLIQICIPLVYAFKVRSSNNHSNKRFAFEPLLCLFEAKSNASEGALPVIFACSLKSNQGKSGVTLNKFNLNHDFFFSKWIHLSAKIVGAERTWCFQNNIAFTSNVNPVLVYKLL
jgi:hypothetical protein